MIPKNKNLIALLLAIIATFLFKGQSIGINIFIFTLCSIGALLFLNPKPNKAQVASALPCMLISVFLGLYPQELSLWMWMFSYIVMCSYMAAPIAPIFAPAQALLSMGKTPIKSIGNLFFTKKINSQSKEKQRLIVIIFSSLIVGFFAVLYISSNPLISELLSFLNPQNIIPNLFRCLFFFVLLWGLVKISPTKELSGQSHQNKAMNATAPLGKDQQEFKIAKISISLVAILLCLLNISDLVVLIMHKLPAGVSFSAYLHQSFNSILFSMALAMGLILYFFRGPLNYHKQIKTLRTLCYFWISQNLVLVCITAYKLQLYTSSYGLTYKRVGVLFLLLCIVVGLLLTLGKLRRPTNNWYFFNKLAVAAYFCFGLGALVPYNYAITRYNLNHSEVIDDHYLSNLSHADYISLIAYYQANNISDNENLSRAQYAYNYQIELANRQDWQSWTLYTHRYKYLDKMEPTIDMIYYP